MKLAEHIEKGRWSTSKKQEINAIVWKLTLFTSSKLASNPLTTDDAIWHRLTLATLSVGAILFEDRSVQNC